MHGVVSILDDKHCALVESIWEELEREFGLRNARAAYPHFTYQIASAYDVDKVEPILRSLARTASPFKVTTSGLGIFTGEKPVLYVRMVRELILTLFHDRLWAAISSNAQNVHHHHYGHTNWIPHITLAYGDLDHDTLARAVRLLSERSFNWEITIDNLALVLDTAGPREDWLRLPFGQ
ncbi:MAG: 2'-5' RNA ligase family protein [Chloroflexota bacterium]|nr:MAG: hypothetical protein DIU68_18315 [Chloroflexota bacterium]